MEIFNAEDQRQEVGRLCIYERDRGITGGQDNIGK